MIHEFITDTQYLPAGFFFAFLVLYVPALAVFPRMLQKPLLFSAVPVVSYLILGVLSYLLRSAHLFHQGIVFIIMIGFLGVSILRTIRFFERKTLDWQRSDVGILLFNFSLIIPLVFLALMSSFATDDALASWNYWAKLYYFSLSSHQALYPTLFPSFLSYCYQLLGSLEPQGIVKVTLPFFMFTVLNAIAFSSEKTRAHLAAYVIVLLLVLFPGNHFLGFYHFYVYGYSDPVLEGVIAISVALLLSLNRSYNCLTLWLTVLTGVAAAWTKQPGLLWAGIVLPLCLLFHFKQNNRLNVTLGVIVCLAAAFGWVLTVGQHFYHNTGVLNASRTYYAGSSSFSYVNVLWHSIQHYLLLQPTLLLLFVLAGLAGCRRKESLTIFIFIIFGLLLWFTLASYELREGLYLIAVSGVLIAHSDFLSSCFPWLEKINQYLYRHSQVFLKTMLIIFIVLGLLFAMLMSTRSHDGLFPLQGGRTTIDHYFVDQPNTAYNLLYKNEKTIVAGTTHYEQGLLFGRKYMIELNQTTLRTILATLKMHRVHYVLISSRIAPTQFAFMQKLSHHCPAQVKPLALGKVRSGYVIFKIQQLASCHV